MTLATGPLSKPFERLAELLAASATFRALVNAADAAEALERIHYPEAIERDDPDNPGRSVNPRPRAVVLMGPEWSREKIANKFYKETAATLVLTIERDLTDEDRLDPASALLRFTNEVGAVILETEALAGAGNAPSGESYFNLVGWDLLDGPGRSDSDAESGADFYGIAFLVRWA